MLNYGRDLWETIKKNSSDLFFQKTKECVLCGQGKGPVCISCMDNDLRPQAPRCKQCGRFIQEENFLCQDCIQGGGPIYLAGITALGYYQGRWKEYIHQFKFYSQPYLLVPLEKAVINWAVRKLPPPDLLIPVPMSEKRISERGFNQAEVLASLLARALLIRQEDGLQRIRETTPQVSLGRQERLKNLKGAFQLRPNFNVAAKVIWLADDVTTTGTTFNECAKVLMEAGAEKVYGFCLAAGGAGPEE
ncbi:phosphoribosyltransferase [Syntrophobotulus glycolicus DSM 8271]|uniref:Phosphoribosyltransferase n=2 Tax=Syntrophobotulus TaxID=51196 RepID=F0T294_SYNGF|nr:phosphoribosyltransferase [Syntrophobotulus glycolicus DSM 8271]